MVEPLPQAETPGRVFPPDPTPAGQGYRSLSVLALVGFGLAAVYAAVVLFLAAYAFISGRRVNRQTRQVKALVPLQAEEADRLIRLRTAYGQDVRRRSKRHTGHKKPHPSRHIRFMRAGGGSQVNGGCGARPRCSIPHSLPIPLY